MVAGGLRARSPPQRSARGVAGGLPAIAISMGRPACARVYASVGGAVALAALVGTMTT